MLHPLQAHYFTKTLSHTLCNHTTPHTQVAQMLLDGKDLQFYQYNGDVSELLDGVRASLNELAEHWTREQKDHCLRETQDAFRVRR